MTSGDLGIAKRLGRLKSGDSRTRTVGSRLSGSEERELIAAAERDGRNVSEWTREVLLREARRSDADPLWTEMIANRMLLLAVLRPIATGQKITPERFDELVLKIKMEKRRAAHEVMGQYKVDRLKEPNDGE